MSKKETQSEALGLAEELEFIATQEVHPVVGVLSTTAAAELRRLDAENKALRELLDAPVAPYLVLPEPAAWTLQNDLDAKRTTTSGRLWFSNPVNCLWTALYTEQQVRALLPAAAKTGDAA